MKKSVKEMGPIQRRTNSLAAKTLITVVLMMAFIGVTMFTAGYSVYLFSVMHEYRANIWNLAKAESLMVNRQDAMDKSEEILKIYDSVSDKERGDGSGQEYNSLFDSVIDDKFRSLQEDMRLMQNEVGLRNAFLVAIDDNANRMIYLVDADPDIETFCIPGTWEEYEPGEIDILLHGNRIGPVQKFFDIGDSYQVAYTNQEKYGPRITGGFTLGKYDDYTIMICLDEKLDHLMYISRVFLVRYNILLIAIVVIAAFIAHYLMKKNLVRPINLMANAAIDFTEDKRNGVAAPNRFSSLHFKTGDEIETLGLSMAEMESILNEYEENLTRFTAERERINTELDLATRIQRDALPSIFPPFPERKEFEIYASMDPAKQVGGDFYDFIMIDDDHLAFLIADVAGKGIPAALFMMVSKVILDNLIIAGMTPAEALERANDRICANDRSEMFVTVWLAVLDLKTGQVVCANAGHEMPVKIDADGKAELIRSKHGFVIGGMEGMKYKNCEIQLEPGDKIFVYTDGLPEATSSSNEMFGTDRMLEILTESRDDDPKLVLDNINNAVNRFVGDAEQFDDLTMLCLKYKGPSR
ncbi:MAG: PP2C family protein-serine/threonine phosphatase [Mogibacterium sp.]|nr:PP2C family protein-serine/threonine phosphatase [Mogibacterium sp.]